ncbi:hypothetical protein [Cohnella silvisoli]|uniref:Uncharacterized protein n=1 Tax=Cohnella silvisoli TaxID=2873699 RepID=A0ABV1KYZ2_9BACL|nr:hypothetical protein [Cohnella silvisoli]MCD9024373.1 hypothetical protein [Cohnella silvisoli]
MEITRFNGYGWRFVFRKITVLKTKSYGAKRIKLSWNKGAGYIGGFTVHFRFSGYDRSVNAVHWFRKAPIIGITRNANRWT